MRAGIALLALCACVAPAAAQGKTKLPASVQVLEMCEQFASGNVLALDAAIEDGWDAYEDEAESPFVQSFSGSKEIAGLGYTEMYTLIEDYSTMTFGYCRVDVYEPEGEGRPLIEAVQDVGRYIGELRQQDGGAYASLTGNGGNDDRLLLTHWDPESFVLQLTIMVPKTETSN